MEVSKWKVISVGDTVLCTETGVVGKVLKFYKPTSCEEQTMVLTDDGRKYHAPTSYWVKYDVEDDTKIGNMPDKLFDFDVGNLLRDKQLSPPPKIGICSRKTIDSISLQIEVPSNLIDEIQKMLINYDIRAISCVKHD